ncbi:hypothetical protein J3B02_004143, partial [Coemansia erecta]
MAWWLVGIPFAIGFTLGPPIGAYFSRMDLNTLSSSSSKTSFGFAPFATAAVFSLVLLLTESLYLFAKLPETLNFRDKNKPQLADSSDTLVEDQSDQEMPKTPKVPEVSARTKQVLRRLN